LFLFLFTLGSTAVLAMESKGENGLAASSGSSYTRISQSDDEQDERSSMDCGGDYTNPDGTTGSCSDSEKPVCGENGTCVCKFDQECAEWGG
jgi:ubiquitin